MYPAHPITDAGQEKAGTRRDLRWVSAALLGLFMLGPAALAVWNVYAISNADFPSDQQLSANFHAHEGSFEDLVRMFNADRAALLASRRQTVSLASLEELVGQVRAGQYLEALKEISVSDIRGDLRSGNLTLLPQGTRGGIHDASKVYRYMPQGELEPLAQHHSYYFRGPGIYFLTGDRLLEKHWFIHHNVAIQIAYSPY
jgi:hypothetical protein